MSSNGLHIRAIRKHDPRDPKGPQMLEVQVYPLPNDQKLLDACYEAARNAIHAVLHAEGVVSEYRTELPPAGDISKVN